MTSFNKQAARTAAGYGLVVAVLYTLLLTQQDIINANFAKGGWHALLPIATAFVFSFAHGKFTGNFWSALGIEPSKKTKFKTKAGK
jgi:hypothetical protein